MREEHSRRSERAFVLGLLGVHGLFPLAAFALLLAVMELSSIAAGEAPVGGRGLARAALWLGAGGLCLPLTAALVWILKP